MQGHSSCSPVVRGCKKYSAHNAGSPLQRRGFVRGAFRWLGFAPRLVTRPGLSIHFTRSPWHLQGVTRAWPMSESLAYDALRVFVNWQRERRLHKVRERKQAARKAIGLLAADGLRYAGDGGQSLAIRVDGSIACWGSNGDGQAPPAGVPGNFVAIAAGPAHSLALRADGSIACWGWNLYGQAPPEGVVGPFFSHND